MALSSDGELLYSASSDKTVAIWDLNICQRVKKIRGHQNIVNSVDIARRGPQMIVSGSDDGTVRLWDRRQKAEVQNFQNTYQVSFCHYIVIFSCHDVFRVLSRCSQ